jgi:hypothetical protein
LGSAAGEGLDGATADGAGVGVPADGCAGVAAMLGDWDGALGCGVTAALGVGLLSHPS